MHLVRTEGAVVIKSKISSIGYVNKIQENVLSIKRRELAPLFEELKAADCVICGGSGRSLYSLNAAMSQIALSQVGWRNKVVLTPDDPGFPGKDMYDAAPDLRTPLQKNAAADEFRKRLQRRPIVMAQDLGRYIEETKTNKFSMGLLNINLRFAPG